MSAGFDSHIILLVPYSAPRGFFSPRNDRTPPPQKKKIPIRFGKSGRSVASVSSAILDGRELSEQDVDGSAKVI